MITTRIMIMIVIITVHLYSAHIYYWSLFAQGMKAGCLLAIGEDTKSKLFGATFSLKLKSRKQSDLSEIGNRHPFEGHCIMNQF